MKQFILMIFITCAGSVASLVEPFWGLLLYYWLAVLRPQYMWKWALPVDLRWSLIAALVIVLSLALNPSKILNQARLNLISGLMIGYGLLLILSVLSAHDTVTAQIWGIEYGKIILMALIAAVLIQTRQQIKIFSLMIALMLGYIAWEINSLYFFDGRLDIFHHGYGDLDNNGAGLLMAMGIPFAYSFAVSSRRIWQRGLFWFLAVLMLHAILMSYSRGAMLAAIVGAVWLLVNHRPRIQAGLIAIILCVVVSVLAGQEIRDRFISMTDRDRDYSAQSRLASWDAGWQLAWQRPLIGQGIRNSNQYTYYYGADNRGRTIHNQYLQIAADSGIPAACIYLVILAVAVTYLQQCRGMCRHYLNTYTHHQINEPSDDQLDEVKHLHNIALGIQGSIITFCAGAMFLSIELVELPWLLVTMAGVMPMIVGQHLHRLSTGELVGIPDTPQPLGHPRRVPGPQPRILPTASA